MDPDGDELTDEPRNRLFIGHYVGNPAEWFLAWGPTLEDAALYVDCETAEPDMDSMREVIGPGLIEFNAKVVDPRANEDDGQPPTPATGEDALDPEDDPDRPYAELKASGHVSLGLGDGFDQNDDWIVERIREPLGEPNEPTPLAPMGVTQKKLADIYRDLDTSE